MFEIRNEKELEIVVMDKDVLSDDEVAKTKINLEEVFKLGKSSKWHQVYYKNKLAGEVFLELEFYN